MESDRRVSSGTAAGWGARRGAGCGAGRGAGGGRARGRARGRRGAGRGAGRDGGVQDRRSGGAREGVDARVGRSYNALPPAEPAPEGPRRHSR
jgi:hypothetical protein